MIIARQDITLIRPGVPDKYGETSATTFYPMKARVTDEVNEKRNQVGDEVTTNLKISIKREELNRSGAVKVTYSDKFRFVDEFGNVTEREPVNIAPARGFSGESPWVRVFV